MEYTKRFLTINEQIALLEKRGLHIDNHKFAYKVLSNVSYYRLRAYTYPFQDNNTDNHFFNKNVTFSQIIEYYTFDKELRLLLFKYLEELEISLRTKLVYHCSNQLGENWYEDKTNFKKHNYFNRDLKALKKEINRSAEKFISHYKTTYSRPKNPPSWIAMEVSSFGLISRLYENLKFTNVKKLISYEYSVTHFKILQSWFHSLSILRNFCAHHSRIWNRYYHQTPKIANKLKKPWIKNFHFNNKKLYYQVCCLKYLLDRIVENNLFLSEFKELLNNNTFVDISDMGFPKNWENEELFTPQ